MPIMSFVTTEDLGNPFGQCSITINGEQMAFEYTASCLTAKYGNTNLTIGTVNYLSIGDITINSDGSWSFKAVQLTTVEHLSLTTRLRTLTV